MKRGRSNQAEDDSSPKKKLKVPLLNSHFLTSQKENPKEPVQDKKAEKVETNKSSDHERENAPLGDLLGNCAKPFDIDKNNKKVMARWQCNREFRVSGMERYFASCVISGDNWEERYDNMLKGKCPLGTKKPLFPQKLIFVSIFRRNPVVTILR